MSTRKHQGKNRILDLPLGMRCIGLGHPGQGSAIRRRRWGFHVTVYSCRFERLSRGRDEDAGLCSHSTFYVHGSETILKVGVSICTAPAQVPVLLLSRLGWRYHRAEVLPSVSDPRELISSCCFGLGFACTVTTGKGTLWFMEHSGHHGASVQMNFLSCSPGATLLLLLNFAFCRISSLCSCLLVTLWLTVHIALLITCWLNPETPIISTANMDPGPCEASRLGLWCASEHEMGLYLTWTLFSSHWDCTLILEIKFKHSSFHPALLSILLLPLPSLSCKIIFSFSVHLEVLWSTVLLHWCHQGAGWHQPVPALILCIIPWEIHCSRDLATHWFETNGVFNLQDPYFDPASLTETPCANTSEKTLTEGHQHGTIKSYFRTTSLPICYTTSFWSPEELSGNPLYA